MSTKSSIIFNNTQDYYFHIYDDGDEDYDSTRDLIRYALRKTHKNIYNLPFVWEKWRLKENV